MEAPDLARAVLAATSVAAALGVAADDATVLHNSNKLALRLSPGDVLARVSPTEQEAQLELDRARILAAAGCPVGTPEPRLEPVVHAYDGFFVTLWTYYAPVARALAAADYADALQRLHAGMREVDLASPRFTDRVAEAGLVATDPSLSPEMAVADRALLAGTLERLRARLDAYAAPEQLLHGEPHRGNVLATTAGPLFVDFETVCTGPVEFDLAHVPDAVVEHYPGVDRELLDVCRRLVLAMVAAWRWRVGDAFPDGAVWRREFLRVLRSAPPWPTLDVLTGRIGFP